MAEDLAAELPERADPTRVERAMPEPPKEAPLVQRRARREERAVYRFRFALAHLALALIAGVGIGGTVLLLDEPANLADAEWSSWRPTGREGQHPSEIADYVSGRYRSPSGSPLVGVIASTPKISTQNGDVSIGAVAIQDDPEGDTDDITIVRTENSLMYTLCGLGEQCSIGQGSVSDEQMRLLRREALELALYTFKYVDDTDSVIALLPPDFGAAANPNDDRSAALFFEKRDLEAQLKQPLQSTLSAPRPPRASEISALEGLTIDRLTESRMFVYSFTQSQAGGAILVLAPFAR